MAGDPLAVRKWLEALGPAAAAAAGEPILTTWSASWNAASQSMSSSPLSKMFVAGPGAL
jgi:hypothetical protein